MIDFTVPSAAEIEAAQRRAVEQADAIVARVVALQPGEHSFANTLLALEEADDLIEKAHGRFGFMSYVAAGAVSALITNAGQIDGRVIVRR